MMDHLLVANANYIKIINQEGVERMQLNILVLQQNLKNIETGGELARASAFYALYAGGMEVIQTKFLKVSLVFSSQCLTSQTPY